MLPTVRIPRKRFPAQSLRDFQNCYTVPFLPWTLSGQMRALNTYSYHGQPRHTVWEVAIIIYYDRQKMIGVDYIQLKRGKKKKHVIVPNKYSLTITS